jgi:hypothetical protein
MSSQLGNRITQLWVSEYSYLQSNPHILLCALYNVMAYFNDIRKSSHYSRTSSFCSAQVLECYGLYLDTSESWKCCS